MPVRFRRRDLGAHHADRLVTRLAEELRSARLSAGLSLRAVARASGISATQVHRIERGRAPNVSLRQLTVLSTVLGMRLSARPYPAGPPLRDAAHARLLSRLHARLGPGLTMTTEVPLHIDGDLRAWDAEVRRGAESVKVEAETALHDLQAVDRRIALKMADDGVERVILLVAATRRNRRVLREYGAVMAARYPLATRAVLAALGAGGLPARSGIAFL